jgi:hypothetical protein
MASAAELKKKLADAQFTIKSADEKLKKLRNDLRNYSGAKSLTPAQTEAAKKINEQIKAEEDKKTEANRYIRENKNNFSNLKNLEDIDNQLKTEIDAYKRAVALGQTPNRSRLNALYSQRQELAKGLGGLAPKAPLLPEQQAASTTTGTNAPTGTVATAPVTSGTKTTKPVISTPTKGTTPAKGTTPDKTDSGTDVSAQGTVNTTTLEGIAAASGVTPGGPTGTPTGTTTGKRTLEQILGDVQNYFDLPDYIFKLDKDLGDLLVRAVNEKWTAERWDKEIENTNWWRKNSSEVRKRLTQFGNYKDLQSQGQDVSKSDYGLWLSKKKRALQADARTIAGYTLTDAEADSIAQKIYLGFLDDDENAIRAFLVPFIGKTTSIVNGMKMTGYSGQALKDYQTLQAIAKANGLSLKDILPGISATTTGGDLEEAVLEKLALGELDVNRISQDARNLAAIGQPQFVRGLLNQGYDLDQVYAPYKNVMSNVLELNPEQISLNDPTLRGAISDKGETNLYDFQKMLRKDSRWQYTQNARQEVGDMTFNVLRDFGFQG